MRQGAAQPHGQLTRKMLPSLQRLPHVIKALGFTTGIVTAPRARGAWASEIAAPVSFSKENMGGVWPTYCAACAGFKAGSFRRACAPHALNRRNILRLYVAEACPPQPARFSY